MSEDNLQFLYKHLLQKRHTDGKVTRECQSDRNKGLSVRELWNKFDFGALKSDKLRAKVSNGNSSSMQTSSSAVSFSKFITQEYSKLFTEHKQKTEAKKVKSNSNQHVKEFIKTEGQCKKPDRSNFSHSFSDKYTDSEKKKKAIMFVSQGKIFQDLAALPKKEKGKLSNEFSKRLNSPSFTPKKDLIAKIGKSPRNFIADKIHKTNETITKQTNIPDPQPIKVQDEKDINFYKEELTQLYRKTGEVFEKFVTREKELENSVLLLKTENDSLKQQLRELKGKI